MFDPSRPIPHGRVRRKRTKSPTGKMASIIRDRNGKQLPIGATLPPEYKELPVGAYNEVVKGPRASNGVAVVCESQDVHYGQARACSS